MFPLPFLLFDILWPNRYRFAYQKLRGYKPVLRARTTELFFLSAGTLLLALGIPILVASLDINQVVVRYDDAGPMAELNNESREQELWKTEGNGVNYSMTVNVKEDMDPPIWVVFELVGFYQNYRRYVRSYDANQMHDNGSNIPGADACLPFRYATMEPDSNLPEDGAIVPCGQIAHSNFNDTYEIFLDGEKLVVDDSNIAWSSDRNHLYGAVEPINYNEDPDFRGGNTSSVVLNQNEHWMVWMRPGAKRTVQKLYGKLLSPLPAQSNVTIFVENRYNTYAFGGAKKLILTTNSWVGGKNLFLPIFYLVIASVCYLVVIGFFLAYDAGLWRKREPGCEDDFSWVRESRN